MLIHILEMCPDSKTHFDLLDLLLFLLTGGVSFAFCKAYGRAVFNLLSSKIADWIKGNIREALTMEDCDGSKD